MRLDGAQACAGTGVPGTQHSVLANGHDMVAAWQCLQALHTPLVAVRRRQRGRLRSEGTLLAQPLRLCQQATKRAKRIANASGFSTLWAAMDQSLRACCAQYMED
jgi:hypothetical protein